MSDMPDFIVKSEVLEKDDRRCDIILKTVGRDYIVFTLSGRKGSVMRREDVGQSCSLTGAREIFNRVLQEKENGHWRVARYGSMDITRAYIVEPEKTKKKVTKPKPKPKPEKVERNITFDL